MDVSGFAPASQIASELLKNPLVQQAARPTLDSFSRHSGTLWDKALGFLVSRLAGLDRKRMTADSDTRLHEANLATREKIQGLKLLAVLQAAERAAQISETTGFAETMKKLEETIPENLQPPPSLTLRPILDGMEDAEDEPELRRLYSNLLAAAMDKSRSDGIHPAFAEIIKQMHPKEALIVKHLAAHRTIPAMWVFRELTVPPDSPSKRIFALESRVVGDASKIGLANNDDIGAYMDNLQRLKLINVPDANVEYEHFEDDPKAYRELMISPPVQTAVRKILDRNEKPILIRNMIQQTSFGVAFCNICLGAELAEISKESPPANLN